MTVGSKGKTLKRAKNTVSGLRTDRGIYSTHLFYIVLSLYMSTEFCSVLLHIFRLSSDFGDLAVPGLDSGCESST